MQRSVLFKTSSNSFELWFCFQGQSGRGRTWREFPNVFKTLALLKRIRKYLVLNEHTFVTLNWVIRAYPTFKRRTQNVNKNKITWVLMVGKRIQTFMFTMRIPFLWFIIDSKNKYTQVMIGHLLSVYLDETFPYFLHYAHTDVRKRTFLHFP